MRERKIPGLKIQGPVEFRDACRAGLRPAVLSSEDWSKLRGIEHAVVGLEQDPWFSLQFANRGKTVDEVLGGVTDMDGLLSNVLSNCDGRKKKERIQAWGLRMWQSANVPSAVENSPLNGHHKVVKAFLERNKAVFEIEIGDANKA